MKKNIINYSKLKLLLEDIEVFPVCYVCGEEIKESQPLRLPDTDLYMCKDCINENREFIEYKY